MGLDTTKNRAHDKENPTSQPSLQLIWVIFYLTFGFCILSPCDFRIILLHEWLYKGKYAVHIYLL